MDSSDCVIGLCGPAGPCYCFLNKKSSVVLISILSLLVTLVETVFPVQGYFSSCDFPGQFAGLRDVSTLHDVLRVFFQAANLLLITASFFETPALMQVYVWGALASIVLGFAAAILDVLLRTKSGSRWFVADFVSEVAFLFVLYLCVPLVDAYRRELEESRLTAE